MRARVVSVAVLLALLLPAASSAHPRLPELPSSSSAGAADCAAIGQWLAETQDHLLGAFLINVDFTLKLDAQPNQQADPADAKKAAGDDQQLAAKQHAVATPPAAREAQAKAEAYLALEIEFYQAWSVPPEQIDLDKLNALYVQLGSAYDDLTTALDALATSCDPNAASTKTPKYTCPPNDAMIANWRASAEHAREEAATAGIAMQSGFYATADRWDQMADNWEQFCASQGG
jgi:hypothetical protein